MLCGESVELLLLKFLLLANLNWATKNFFIKKYQSFPIGVNWWRTFWAKMTKNSIKMAKSVFFDQNSGGGRTSKI